MSSYKVIITDDRFSTYDEEKEVLSRVGAYVEIYNFNSSTEFPPGVLDADAILINLCLLGSAVIRQLSRCRIISRYGVGYDNVDVKAATEAGIWVANVPDYCKEEVSDHALALLFNCIRKISYVHKKIREEKWNIHRELSITRIKGKTLGFIGYGRIARTLHHKIQGFGLQHVLVYDPYVDPRDITRNGGVSVTMEEVLQQSDFISIHVPLTKETEGFIGEKELGLMKKESILINTSRGAVIREHDLIRALEAGALQCAGLDVFEQEPLDQSHPFLCLDNVVLTSHMAYYSVEALHELKIKAAENIAAVLKGGKPLYPVNSL